jgi:hypothetical protein
VAGPMVNSATPFSERLCASMTSEQKCRLPTGSRARARRSTAATAARSFPPGIQGCVLRRAARRRITCAPRVRRRKGFQAPGAAASVEWVRAARLATPRRRPRAAERGLRRSPSPLRGKAATMQPHWLAGSAKQRSRRASRPDNALRNQPGRRCARRRLATAEIFCLRRPLGRGEEEPPVLLPRRRVPPPLAKRELLRQAPALWRAARVPAPLAQVPAPRSPSVAIRRRRAPLCKMAILWQHCTLDIQAHPECLAERRRIAP